LIWAGKNAMHRSCLLSSALALLVTLAASLPAGAGAHQGAKIQARFTPERLGAATTVSLGFQLSARNGASPAALSTMQLVYPPNLGLATSGLGVASCSPSALEALGAEGCPANSRMGTGSATVEIVLKVETVKEHVSLQLFAGPSPDGYLHVIVYASGVFPVYAQLLLSGVLLHGQLSMTVPPIPTFPEAPDVVMTQMQLTLGGSLTYYEHSAGGLIPYRPAGVGLPSRCPTGGFPFAARFLFMNGGHAKARTAVPCPGGA
jgi:hypothetical protein